MRTTIDRAGRVVIPKELRDRVGLQPGEVELVAEGGGIRIEPVAADDLLEDDQGRLLIPASGASLDDETVRALRDADRR